jgi:spore maturation protein CgeB
MLSERTDDLKKLYKEDEEAVFFSCPEELVEKAKVLLKNEIRRKQIAKAGRQRCTADGHDVVNRMRQLCRVVA